MGELSGLSNYEAAQLCKPVDSSTKVIKKCLKCFTEKKTD